MAKRQKAAAAGGLAKLFADKLGELKDSMPQETYLELMNIAMSAQGDEEHLLPQQVEDFEARLEDWKRKTEWEIKVLKLKPPTPPEITFYTMEPRLGPFPMAMGRPLFVKVPLTRYREAYTIVKVGPTGSGEAFINFMRNPLPDAEIRMLRYFYAEKRKHGERSNCFQDIFQKADAEGTLEITPAREFIGQLDYTGHYRQSDGSWAVDYHT